MGGMLHKQEYLIMWNQYTLAVSCPVRKHDKLPELHLIFPLWRHLWIWLRKLGKDSISQQIWEKAAPSAGFFSVVDGQEVVLLYWRSLAWAASGSSLAPGSCFHIGISSMWLPHGHSLLWKWLPRLSPHSYILRRVSREQAYSWWLESSEWQGGRS